MKMGVAISTTNECATLYVLLDSFFYELKKLFKILEYSYGRLIIISIEFIYCHDILLVEHKVQLLSTYFVTKNKFWGCI